MESGVHLLKMEKKQSGQHSADNRNGKNGQHFTDGMSIYLCPNLSMFRFTFVFRPS